MSTKPSQQESTALPDKGVLANMMRTPTARDYLQNALLASSTAPSARAFFGRHPQAREVAERMAWYITDRVPHRSGHMLLDAMIRSAFKAIAEQRQGSKGASRGVYADQLVAFYGGLCRLLPALMEVDVAGVRGRRWDPLVGMPLGQWLQTESPATFTLGELDDNIGSMRPDVYRSAIATYIFTSRDLSDCAGRMDEIVAKRVA